MKNEIYNLQILRGIAALIVLAGHLSPPSLSQYIPQGQIGVSIFFFISGFIMAYSFKNDESGGAFLIKRILRIYPPYLILSSGLIIYFFSKSLSLDYLFHNLTLIPFIEWDSSTSELYNTQRSVANPVSWTLYYEMYFYFIFSVMKFFFVDKKGTILMTAITMASIMVISSFFIKNSALGFSDLSLYNMISSLSLLSFIAGMLAERYSKSINKKKPNSYIFTLIIMSWFLIHIFEKYKLINSDQVIDLIFSSIPSWIICVISINSKTYTGMIFDKIYKIGEISYSMYLVHGSFYILKNKMQLSTAGGLIYFITATMVSMYLASLSYKFIERNKIFKVKKRAEAI